MPDFAAAAARIAARAFACCGDAATYTRTDGSRIATRAVLVRGYQAEGYSSSRRLTVQVPVGDIGAAQRGDCVDVEGESFEVQQELARDQILIELLVRHAKPAEASTAERYA